jgi:hypothetical protein
VTFVDVAPYFSAVLAPGVVALARRRYPRVGVAVDGLLVWLAVAGAAVLFSVGIGVTVGEPFGVTMVRRGLLLGFLACAGHTLATGRGRPPVAPLPDAPSTLDGMTVPVTPRNDVPRMQLDFDDARPSER